MQIQTHFIDDDALIRAARRLVREEERDQMEASLRRWLGRQPLRPDLVGPTVAAEILGVAPPHIARLKAQNRMPQPIPVDGSFDVYVRGELMPLAHTLAESRARRRPS